MVSILELGLVALSAAYDNSVKKYDLVWDFKLRSLRSWCCFRLAILG
jgi:hypothetical protein